MSICFLENMLSFNTNLLPWLILDYVIADDKGVASNEIGEEIFKNDGVVCARDIVPSEDFVDFA